MENLRRRYSDKIFDAIPGYISVQDREFRLTAANDSFRKDFGEIEGRYCYQVYKQRPEKCEDCPVERTFRDGQKHQSEEIVRTNDGRDVHVLVYTTPIRNDSGEVTDVIEMSTDITELKNLHNQLTESRSRYRHLFEEVPCFISIQDRDLRIIEANRLHREAFGTSYGNKCYEVYKHRTEECYPCLVKKTFEDGETHIHEEVVTSKAGKKINVLVFTMPIKNQDGEIQSVIEYLSSDLLEGRAPGTRGGELAEEYLRSLFKQLDIGPYEGDYFQQFTLRGFSLLDLSIEAKGVRLGFLDDAVGSYPRDDETFSLSGGAVFVGFGIMADAWSWDDYKDSDVTGKIVICRVNEPGRDDPDLFEGDALTFYGRWTYKIEEAARRGARGILLVHSDDTAGYGWHVVRNSWGGEELYLPSQLENDLEFRGWVREKKLREILSAAGRDLDGLYEESERREFEPVDLGFSVSISGRGESRSLTTRNVVGIIPGVDPLLRGKSIVLSAHIDHLGMKEALPGDDTIFNGAIDNGSAVAAMVMTAKLLRERREELHYSIIVLACQAEEAGLLGSRHFAERIDPASVVCNINFESTPVWGPSRSIFGLGAEYSTIEQTLEIVVSDLGLGYSMFSMTDRGFFYRSDQFSFARRGIPSIWISAGEDYEDGINHQREFFTGAYHTVDDEYDPLWELVSTRQTIEAAVLLALRLDRETARPTWKRTLPFPVEHGGVSVGIVHEDLHAFLSLRELIVEFLQVHILVHYLG